MSYSDLHGMEHRREARVVTRLPVDLGFARGVTRDVSASGCYVETDFAFQASMSAIDFSLSLPSPLGCLQRKCKGRILRTERDGSKTGMAIEILESVIVAD